MMIVRNNSDYVSIKCSGHSTAAGDTAKCLSNSIISPATRFSKLQIWGILLDPGEG